ncbi:TonB-dependent receptor [Sphingomonas sp. S-NIH.Pt15_0812]|uniref:TonB-dependent receptor n=1 Tax=Sphingomonas sp. S-NIH.Pt15_0812 TaxID=1920129 RepID=UPI000F7DFEDB|nr:TonB-dependent receptor [Sphingomonas sp. S-NIH.Pt15_0812]RSU53009.1 TonB-dependent siderophore receptor [Sphingomonas sp. S-NIH.Pt15_0812]
MSTAAAPFLALSCVGFIASAPAMAADHAAAPVPAERIRDAQVRGQDARRETARDEIVVNGRPGAAPAMVESPKATSALLDTPQTITVISDQTLRKQNLLTLRDALQTIPGITFGAGEGGGGYGDSINLRGFSANNDITVDGVRDSAQYSRTDPFNLQQIEVYNGANSVFNGSGSVGGTINLVTKEPRAEDLTIVQASVGTDDYWRGSVDANRRIGADSAVRLNAVVHRNDVPGRKVERYKRWGIAPSVTIGIDGPTSLTLAYVHQQDDNTPIYGVPYFRSAVNDGPLPGVSRAEYFGIANLDRQKVTVDRFTATFRHDAGDGVSLRNLTRWQRVGQRSVTSAPQGLFCLASTGRQPVGANGSATVGLPCTGTVSNVAAGGPDGTGTALSTVAVTVAPGFYQPSGPRGLVRDQENQLLYNQTDLRWERGEKGGVRNVANIGLSGTIEDYRIDTASLLRNAAGAPILLPQISLANPNTDYAGSTHYTLTAQSKSTTRNLAVYAFDTLELGRYFELNGGVRWEVQDASFRQLPLAVTPPGTAPLTALQQAPQQSHERLFSYRIGGVFHPVANVSLYAGYGNAKTPSSATVRLGCGVPTVTGNTLFQPCDVAPETARNYEAGVKAGLFDRRLELTAAVFRNERTNYRVASNDPTAPQVQVLDGRSRVDGIALGATGSLTRRWTIFANYTYLDSEVQQSVSGRCLATPGLGGCGNSAANPDPQRGTALPQTPHHSGSLFTTYTLPFGLELGYGLTYQGKFATYSPVLANGTQFRVDDYLIHRAYLAYSFGGGLTAQLNVQNVTDAKYFTTVRSNVNATTGAVTGGWAMPGDRRQAVLSLFYSF